MATMFAVFASTLETMHEPVFTPIEFEVDVDSRRGRMTIPGHVTMTGKPLRNNVTGAEVRAQIHLPDGFEYDTADVGSASSRGDGIMPIELDSSYAQFAHLHLDSHGVVRA
jgi:hypothetical protein